MFGFIASPCGRCSGDALPAWRGSFCGLARCLARDYGAPARLLVNRDATFLALLGLSLDPEPPRWRRATCCNPLAAPFPVDDQHPAIRHAAAVSVCGLAAKLADDACDEGPLRRVFSRLAGALTSVPTDRAIARLNSTGFPTARVLEALRGQDEVELRSPLDADAPTAEAFARITVHLSRLVPSTGSEDALWKLGSSLGSLVYWRDAWDDREDDRRRSRFNPHSVCPPERIRERVDRAWNDFTEATSRLPISRHGTLIGSLQVTTRHHHGDFLGHGDTDERPSRKRRRARGRDERDRDSCCNWCDCYCCDCPSCSCGRGAAAGRGGCGDACVDCGPGDSGCCDCCPCDGCDCCPCN